MEIENYFGPEKAMYCKLCGRQLDYYDVIEDYSIVRRLGYGTKYDGEYIDLRLCCDCMEQLIDRCKISPIVADPAEV